MTKRRSTLSVTTVALRGSGDRIVTQLTRGSAASTTAGRLVPGDRCWLAHPVSTPSPRGGDGRH